MHFYHKTIQTQSLLFLHHVDSQNYTHPIAVKKLRTYVLTHNHAVYKPFFFSYTFEMQLTRVTQILQFVHSWEAS